MTAKEKLRAAIEELSEAEAAATLDLIDARSQSLRRDAMTELLDNAPIDDEPESDEERAAVAEAREALRRGETVSLDEVHSEFR